jgi:hypothetical protein
MIKILGTLLSGRRRVVLAWAGLVVATVLLLQWVEPAVFESPYAGF